MKPQNKINILIIFIFTIIFASQNSLFKKTYFLLKQSYVTGFASTYQFCGGESIGFLKKMKKKYSISTNPIIYNYQNQPSSYWSIFDTSQSISDSEIFFLNYPEKFEMKFIPFDNLTFRNTNQVQTSSGIISIRFTIDGEINLNSEISIYKKTYENKKIIHKFRVDEVFFNQKEFFININSKELNSSLDRLFIKFSNGTNNLEKIKKIDLLLKNKFNLDNYNLIEQYERCFYVKK